MKKVYFIFSLLAFTFFSCKKEAGPVLPSPAGLYDSMIYLKTDIQIQEVAYSTRPNFQNFRKTTLLPKWIFICHPMPVPLKSSPYW